MKTILFAVVAFAVSITQAHAVSHAVKMACAGDYFAHCSMHAVGSPGVRKCMRAVGKRLSQGCISALRDAGEIKSRVAVKAKKPAKHYAAAKHSKKYASKKSYGKKVYAKLSNKRYATKTWKRKGYGQKRMISKSRRKEYAKRYVVRG